MKHVLMLLAQLVAPVTPNPPQPVVPASRAPVIVVAAAPSAGRAPVYFLKGAPGSPEERLVPAYRPRGPGTPRHALEGLLAGPGPDEAGAGIRSALLVGAVLLRLDREDGETIVDLSDAGGPAEVPRAAAQIAATLHAFPEIQAVRVCVRGEPVRAVLRAQFLNPSPFIAPAEGSAPLAGKVIVVSGGHGWTLRSNGRWLYQRPQFGNTVEDEVNALFALQTARVLRRLGATVYLTRAGAITGEPGVSGASRWQEASKYFLRDIGVPDWVYQPLPSDFDSDIDARPLYANYRGADLLISLHNNIGGGTGTLTLYDTANGFAAESARLAHLLQERIVGAIRDTQTADWRSLGVKGSSARYGENHWAHMPSALVEIAFMDRRHDRAFIESASFRAVVAGAVAAAVAEYFGVAVVPDPAGPDPADTVEPVTAPRPAVPAVVACVGDPAGSVEMEYAGRLQRALDAESRGEGQRVAAVAGSGGRPLSETLARWQRDIVPLRPSFVLIAPGPQDLASADGAERFEADLVEVVRRTRALGAVPVLGTIAPLRDSGAVQSRRDDYNAAVRRVARQTVTRLADVSRAAWRREAEWLHAADGERGGLSPAGASRVAGLFLERLAPK